MSGSARNLPFALNLISLRSIGGAMDEGAAAHWLAVQALFDRLVDASPPDQDRSLAESDASPGVIAKARAMLAAHRAEGILDGEAPPLEEQDAAGGPVSLSIGQVIGGFTIDAYLGRGGMGEVYLAHRSTAEFMQKGCDQIAAGRCIRPRPAFRARAPFACQPPPSEYCAADRRRGRRRRKAVHGHGLCRRTADR